VEPDRIVFMSDRDDDQYDIYIMGMDGSNQEWLTTSDVQVGYYSCSPDGRRIVYNVEDNILTVNDDGTRNIALLSGRKGYESAWSPDGRKIVLHSFRHEEQVEIYIMDRGGSNMTRLTDNSAEDYIPRWLLRKRGVEDTEASVIIPDAPTLKDMTVEEVTARARQAVVRIKTNLGSGSGFIIDPSGVIMTNNHVISDAEEITVYLEDGTSYTGTVWARDLVRDLALVKVKATQLPYLELGDLGQMSLGQQVVLLGYPLKTENVAVTSGLVSTIDFDSGRNITWVQTDSAINPGNSGGPMLNLQGQVIGVVSAKMVGIAVEGMDFAISANTVNMHLPRLEAGEVIMTF